MANKGTPHARLIFALVLAAMGIGCTPTAMPLPMLAAGYSSPQASASAATTQRGDKMATRPSAR